MSRRKKNVPDRPHDRLRPMVLHIMDNWDRNAAAEMIMNLCLSQNAPEGAAPPRGAPLMLTHEGSSGRRKGRNGTAQLDPIEPNKKYTVKESADLLEIEEGTFRAWYAKAEQAKRIVVGRDKRTDGRHKIHFMGSELIKARELRNGSKNI